MNTMQMIIEVIFYIFETEIICSTHCFIPAATDTATVARSRRVGAQHNLSPPGPHTYTFHRI